MSECYREFFIQNSIVIKSEEFLDSTVSEGTSLYEVIRIIDKVPLFLERHLQRLENSAEIVNLKLWMDSSEVKENLKKLIEVNKVDNGNIKIVFNYKKDDGKVKHTFLAYFIKHKYPEERQYEEGVPTILCFIERNNPNAKIINTEFKRITDEKIKQADAYEAILVDRNDNITEGSRSNIFMVKGDTVLTAPLLDVLPGITRQVIMEICKAEGISLKEEKINYKDLKKLDGLFITGTSPKVLPVSKIEDMSFDSSNNSIVQRIMKAYNNIIIAYKSKNNIT